MSVPSPQAETPRRNGQSTGENRQIRLEKIKHYRLCAANHSPSIQRVQVGLPLVVESLDKAVQQSKRIAWYEIYLLRRKQQFECHYAIERGNYLDEGCKRIALSKLKALVCSEGHFALDSKLLLGEPQIAALRTHTVSNARANLLSSGISCIFKAWYRHGGNKKCQR
ncbi:hypothetical protein [Burkholderia pseudomallei]|uniref:hypothetical protein n=1 Tax=Burkholderia pseudomallei TaxID=28450 RepID=UPI000536AF84|nr:hypothetical protein [Burkholderia pseudomallei]KGW27595.1 hypothetical protein Y047_1891 [Burkholderia pseudomallei MSHR3016]KGW29725.1 hypothetical protein Y045_1542 [Burkholderia pseudomallei MSHR2451]